MPNLIDEDNHYLPLKAKFRNNPLLKRPYVGRGKASAYALPKNKKHVYGKPNPPKDVPASMVINGWKFHTPTEAKEDSKQRKNFVKINRMALKNGKITAKEVNDFRKNTLKNAYRRRKECKSPLTKLKEEMKRIDRSRVYGKPSNVNGDDTNMKWVMSMTYYSKWVKSQENLFQQKFKTYDHKNGKYSQIKPTKASIGHSAYYKALQNKIIKEKHTALEMQKYKKSKYDYIKPKVSLPDNNKRPQTSTGKRSNNNRIANRPFSAVH